MVDLFNKTFWLVSVCLFINHFQTALSQGMLIAFGKQRFVAMTTSIPSILIGLPVIIATIFFTDLGVPGIVLGWIINDVLILIAGLIRVLTIDISKEIEKSRVRVAESIQVSNFDDSDEAKPDDKEREPENEYLLGVEQKRGGLKDDEMGKCSKKSSYMEGGSWKMLADTGTADVAKTPREAKIVLFTFLFLAVHCACLAGISLLRD